MSTQLCVWCVFVCTQNKTYHRTKHIRCNWQIAFLFSLELINSRVSLGSLMRTQGLSLHNSTTKLLQFSSFFVTCILKKEIHHIKGVWGKSKIKKCFLCDVIGQVVVCMKHASSPRKRKKYMLLFYSII